MTAPTFTQIAPMLSNRALLLAKIETTYNTDANPVVGSDAFLVESPDFVMEPKVLERNFARPSLSPIAINIGRKLAKMTFKHEMKGSGANQTAAKIGTLLKGCGFAETQIANTAGATIVAPVAATTNTSPTVTFANTTASTATGRYTLTVVKGGASATAKVRVSGTPSEVDQTVLASETFSAAVTGVSTFVQGLTVAGDFTSITYTVGGTVTAGDKYTAVIGGITFTYTMQAGDTLTPTGAALILAALINADPRMSASPAAGIITVTFLLNAVGTTVTTAVTAVTIGNSAAQITPSWSGSLVVSDSWALQVLAPGWHYTPVTTGFQSLTMYMYRDAVLHKMTGSMGDVTFDGTAGEYGMCSFTFTGQYVAPTDTALPTSGVVFETSLPVQIQNAQLSVNGNQNLCAQKFQVGMKNTVVPRDAMNLSDGYNGVRITGRKPAGSFNPETVPEASGGFWTNMAAATSIQFGLRVGTAAGNIVHLFGDNVQYGAMKYGNRNGLLIYDIPIMFAAFSANGNDEIRIVTQ